MTTVTILQYRLFHYRLEFFECLKQLLSERNILLEVVAGQPFGAEKDKKDTGHLPWVREVSNLYFPIGEKKDLCWQHIPADLKRSELLIVMQENRLLRNYWLLAKRRIGGPKVAFWGHGRDFQTNAPHGLREHWKKWWLSQPDWWFAYTQVTVDILRESSYPSDRITCVNNAIDVSGLRRDAAQVGEVHLRQLREGMDLLPEGFLGILCGSLYREKNIDFLLQSADIVHGKHPGFRLAVIGDGSEAGKVRAASESRPWLKWVGVKRGAEKAAYYQLATCVLNPGLVGLHILDSLALGVPMITTREAKHSPEIAYLSHGVNGFITDGDPEVYADTVLKLASDEHVLRQMKAAALRDGSLYTVEAMAERFCEGIVSCLSRQKRGFD